MTIKAFIQSQTFKGILVGFGLAIVLLLVFQAGVGVGMHKASYARGLGDSFERNFAGPQRMMLGMRGDSMFFAEGVPGGHGAVGKIVSIALPDMVIAGPDAIEKTVRVTHETAIREFRSEITGEDLAVGQYVVVLGESNDEGQITAALIRVLPQPPENMEEQFFISTTSNRVAP